MALHYFIVSFNDVALFQCLFPKLTLLTRHNREDAQWVTRPFASYEGGIWAGD